jgi:hypothetical protein
MTGHVAEIVGHNPETAGHVHPTYADIVRHGPKYSAKPRTTPGFTGFLSSVGEVGPSTARGIRGQFRCCLKRYRPSPIGDTTLPLTEAQVRNARYNPNGTGNRA